MTCEHTLDDGAYVLGALSPAERADFERHLSTCASCREAVANLAVLPGLLGRLDQASAVSVAAGTPAPVPAPATVLPRVLAATAQQRRFDRRRGRRRRALLSTAFTLLALMLVFGVGAMVHMRDTQSTPIPMSAMRPADQTWGRISADVGVRAADGGSELVMTCWYAESHETGNDKPWVLQMVVFDKAQHQPETIGTWTAAPGAKVTVSGRTHLTPAQIDKVELQRPDGSTLLWWSPPS
jgi:Putative zinc-finger